MTTTSTTWHNNINRVKCTFLIDKKKHPSDADEWLLHCESSEIRDAFGATSRLSELRMPSPRKILSLIPLTCANKFTLFSLACAWSLAQSIDRLCWSLVMEMITCMQAWTNFFFFFLCVASPSSRVKMLFEDKKWIKNVLLPNSWIIWCSLQKWKSPSTSDHDGFCVVYQQTINLIVILLHVIKNVLLFTLLYPSWFLEKRTFIMITIIFFQQGAGCSQLDNNRARFSKSVCWIIIIIKSLLLSASAHLLPCHHHCHMHILDKNLNKSTLCIFFQKQNTNNFYNIPFTCCMQLS